MAKINTYPVASPPSLSSMLIGTDMDDNSNTKNFTIGEILGLIDISSLVPYSGALGDVNLGGFDIIAETGSFQEVAANNGSFTDLYIGGEAIYCLGQYFSMNEQNQTSTSSSSPVFFENGVITNKGVSLLDPASIIVNTQGVFMITLNARVNHSSGGGGGSAARLTFWIKKDSADVPFSRQEFSVANNTVQVITYTFLMQISPAESVSIYWSTSDTNAGLLASPGTPDDPSAIVHVYKVGL